MAIHPIEKVKSTTKEVANWFTVRRAIGVAAAALAFGALGNALIGDMHDEQQAVPYIKADGFKTSTSDVHETIGGEVLNIDSLRVGSCNFEGVTAHLSFGDGGVTDVSDYTVPLSQRVVEEDMISSYNLTTASVTVQNAKQLQARLPKLDC